MECERLTKLIRNWYTQVTDETLAPARMVDFMRAHLDSCPTCHHDPVVEAKVKKISEMVLPAKVAKPAPRDDAADLGEDEDLVIQDGEELGEEEEVADDELVAEAEEVEDEEF